MTSTAALPIVDLREAPSVQARTIHAACTQLGFFYVVGHGVDEALGQRLEDLSHRFFALPEDRKAKYAMALGGRAWRGWFPLGGELTSGRPDWKEGLYLGTDLPDADPRVRAGVADRRYKGGRYLSQSPLSASRRSRGDPLPPPDCHACQSGHVNGKA